MNYWSAFVSSVLQRHVAVNLPSGHRRIHEGIHYWWLNIVWAANRLSFVLQKQRKKDVRLSVHCLAQVLWP